MKLIHLIVLLAAVAACASPAVAQEAQEPDADSLAAITTDSLRYYSPAYSFYNSISTGFDRNPLYYYAMPGDQTKGLFTQAMFQQNFARSAVNVTYMGTLTTFNTFQQRNYYEHNLSTQYRIDFRGDRDAVSPKTWSDPEEFAKVQTTNLTFGVNVCARWDREFYRDFNNTGLEFGAAYKNRADSVWIYGLKNTFGYRSYTVINELSNITEIMQFDVARVARNGFHTGISMSAGMKYYTQPIYDTAIFIVPAVPPGNGKGNPGKAAQTQTSLKPQSNGSYQLTMALFGSKKWDAVAVEGTVQYRYDIQSQARFLGKYVNTTFLSEDIYNEVFAYHGVECRLVLTCDLPLGVQMSAASEIRNKDLGMPAFNLEGAEIAPQRTDLASSGELGFAKFYELGSGMSMDVSASFTLLRNQSNDDYNDYSSYSASVSVGFGF